MGSIIENTEESKLDMNSPIPTVEQDKKEVDTTTTDGRQEHISKNIQRKEMMLADLFEDGVPTDNRDKRMALEIMNSSDDALLRLEKIAKDSENKNMDESEIRKEMALTLRESFRIASEFMANAKPSDVVVDESEYDGEILESSLEIGKKVLESADYMEGKTDA